MREYHRNLESTGIGACACARHGSFVPHSVMDSKREKGNVESKVPRSIAILHKADQYGLFHLQFIGIPHRPWTHALIIYDVACSGLLTFTNVCKTVTS